jgi:flagellar protein FlaG
MRHPDMLTGDTIRTNPAGAGALGHRALSSSSSRPSSDVGGEVEDGQARGHDTRSRPTPVHAAVAHINRVLASASRELTFSVDEVTGKTVVRVMDQTTGKVVRQIPSEVALALAARLDADPTLASVVVDTRA